MSDRKHDATTKTGIGRRAFIRRTGLGAGALGAAAAGLSGKAAPAAAGEAKPGGYRETPHVKTYYKSAKF
jgi:hypothetical protein